MDSSGLKCNKLIKKCHKLNFNCSVIKIDFSYQDYNYSNHLLVNTKITNKLHNLKEDKVIKFNKSEFNINEECIYKTFSINNLISSNILKKKYKKYIF